MSTIHGLLDVRCVGCGNWGTHGCAQCLHTALRAPINLTMSGVPVFALGAYRGPLRDIVRAVKFSGERALLGRLAPAVESLGARFPGAVAIPVPASRSGFVARGFHLTRRIAHRTGLRTSTALVLDDSGSQRQRRRIGRLRGRPMHVARRALRPGTRVVIVDDVITTGATVRSAIDACRLAGLTVVGAIALAATPPVGNHGDSFPNVPVRV